MPKLVRHSHGNEVYQAWACGLMLRMRAGMPLLFGLPLFHVGGALTQGLRRLCAGGTLVVLSPPAGATRTRFATSGAWSSATGPSVFGGVPTVLGAALNVPVDGADVSSIRYCSGGGSAIPVAIGKAYAGGFQVPVLEVYGMTETSSVHSLAYPRAAGPTRLGRPRGAVQPGPRRRARRREAAGAATARRARSASSRWPARACSRVI